MGRSRTSRRRSGKGLSVKHLVVAGLLVGVSYGAYELLSGGDEQRTPTEAEMLLGTDTVLQQAQEMASASSRSVENSSNVSAEYQHIVNDVRRSLQSLSGQERYAALVAGYRRLEDELKKPLAPSVRIKMLPAFHDITDELFFSSIRNDFSENYTVKPGDSIGKIANKLNVTEELICDWNNIEWAKRSQIRAGSSYKIVKGEPRLVVDKSDFCLSFYFGENLARQFIVAHGRGNGTPEGATKVNGKIVDPDTSPHAGAMQQEMDERWIGFSQFGSRTGIGIHGTKYEESIPGETSHGCVRMFNRDVVELYRWVPYGASVEIRA